MSIPQIGMKLHTSHTTSHCPNSYLRQVFDETLRLSALAPFAARYSDHDIVVGGYKVPAGTPIVHALGVSLKSETKWDNPNR